ncbi:MAG: glycosyltransferase family 2 protein, partial [Actinomycetota bacterium]
MNVPKSNNSPLVTVIIPTFNHAQHLRKALDSVVAQTFQDWEVVVVNNHSTDDTVEVVAATNDSRISLVNFHNHGVIGAARNQGLKVARGEFVAFLDSDDVWYPQKLQRCVEQISDGGEFICHGELWINSDKTSRKVFYGPVENSSYEKLLFRGNCISTSTTFIKTELLRSIDGFDESPEIVTAEDYDLWLRLAATGAKTVFIKEILGEFHR